MSYKRFPILGVLGLLGLAVLLPAGGEPLLGAPDPAQPAVTPLDSPPTAVVHVSGQIDDFVRDQV